MRTVGEGLQPWYITGLAEAAGTFTFSRTDRNVIPYFALKLSRDDGNILPSIQAYFGGLGRIYDVGRGPGSSGHIAETASRYFRVTRVHDLDIVISHFDDYPLRGPKAGAYGIWRELVTLKRTGYRKPDRGRIDELCRLLSDQTRRASLQSG